VPRISPAEVQETGASRGTSQQSARWARSIARVVAAAGSQRGAVPDREQPRLEGAQRAGRGEVERLSQEREREREVTRYLGPAVGHDDVAGELDQIRRELTWAHVGRNLRPSPARGGSKQMMLVSAAASSAVLS
jgi:hypothetical protein